MPASLYLGIDIGTSGIRASCIDSNADEVAAHQIPFDSSGTEQNPIAWQQLLFQLLGELTDQLATTGDNHKIAAIAIDGTSSTILACKKDGTPLSPALMYNHQQCIQQAERINQHAPSDSAVHGASSSLSKALYLLEKHPDTELLCHQADWLAGTLTGVFGTSDENNCLKLGYDSIKQCWPQWLLETELLKTGQENTGIQLPASVLPEVVPPGTVIAEIKAEFISRFQLAEHCKLVAGTTDSNAAVLATGASQPGDAVTSLGSTLVVKLFSDKPLFQPEYGIYSHRLNGHWLAGGASNSGGAVLLKYFTRQQLDEMTPQLQPGTPTGLDYYPLPGTGERFPENNPARQSHIEPRPDSDIEFFQGLLEGMAKIEAEAYNKLQQLGANQPGRIFTAGGGSNNVAWTAIRERTTGVEILAAAHTEASYGAALLARQGFNSHR